jgi:hypothetical protein
MARRSCPLERFERCDTIRQVEKVEPTFLAPIRILGDPAKLDLFSKSRFTKHCKRRRADSWETQLPAGHAVVIAERNRARLKHVSSARSRIGCGMKYVQGRLRWRTGKLKERTREITVSWPGGGLLVGIKDRSRTGRTEWQASRRRNRPCLE